AHLQPGRHRVRRGHRRRHGARARAHPLWAHRARHRREPRDGRGDGRRPGARLLARVRARRGARRRRRRARGPGHRRHQRDGHRRDRGGVRGGRHRRSRQHARRLRRRPDRRRGEGGGHRHLAGGRDAGRLRDRHRRARPAAGGTLRAGHRVIVRALGVAACAALLLLPFAGRPYTTTLLLPAFGYAIALLGLNLLFGSAGLLSFGHALVVALGGYTAALLTSRPGVRHLETVPLAAAVTAAVFGGVGGALLVVPTGLAEPLLAYWTHSGNLIFMLVLGGFDHFFGPVLGAVVFILLQDQVMSLTPYWRFVFGAILAVVVVF